MIDMGDERGQAPTTDAETGSISAQQMRSQLKEMALEDLRVRDELLAEGVLHAGYHPRMEALHRRHARRLEQLLDDHGWPDRAADDEAADAAWLIVQHAIGEPGLQRRCLALLQDPGHANQVSPVHLAMLDDRISCFEGRPQRYGTQFDWDDDGLMSPLPVDDPDAVDERRRRLGLPTLAEQTAQHRRAITDRGATRPHDLDVYRREREAWLESAGWR